MGHKNVETTLDIYTEVNYNKKKDSLEELASKAISFNLRKVKGKEFNSSTANLEI